MFVNNDKQAVFVHVMKSGGTSLLSILDNGKDLHEGGFINEVHKTKWYCPIGQHASFKQLKGCCPDIYETITDYYKFGVVRNPWAHAVSKYFYDTHIHHLTSTLTWDKGHIPMDVTLKNFNKYLNEVYVTQDMHVLEDDDAMDVDWLKLENFNKEVRPLMLTKLRYKGFKGSVPHKNKNADTYTNAWGLKYPKHYNEFFDGNQQAIDTVARRSKTLIDKFGYQYEAR